MENKGPSNTFNGLYLVQRVLEQVKRVLQHLKIVLEGCTLK